MGAESPESGACRHAAASRAAAAAKDRYVIISCIHTKSFRLVHALVNVCNKTVKLVKLPETNVGFGGTTYETKN